MAAFIFLLVLLLLAFTTSMAQTNCTMQDAEAGALKTVLEALGWKLNSRLCNITANVTEISIDSEATKTSFACDNNCHVTEISYTNQYAEGYIHQAIGNLVHLRTLNIACSGLGREIPSALAHLTSLEVWRGNGNDFNGTVPDIFTNMGNLKDLRLYGNNFIGPLPPSLQNLTKLEYLYMGDMFINTSIPYTLKNLRTLKELSLQGCQLFGEIPNIFGTLKDLTYLDLSFNKLTGVIPAELELLSHLETLLLENNSLNGELRNSSNLSNLQRLDVSFNNLSGSIPGWLNNKTNVNLIWNSFTISNANGRLLSPIEFNCNEPNCRDMSGNNHKIYINCGGNNLTTLSNIVYDSDKTNMGDIYFTKSASKTWAVSTTGYIDASFQHILETGPYQTISDTTSDRQDLYMNARASPSSLRYYGLNMKNGNYDVTLHFAEISKTVDGSNIKRIFDIYIQGTLFRKDYNIMERKTNKSFAAVEERIPTSVKNGILQIHLKWSGKGSIQGPLICAITIIPAGGSKFNVKVIALTLTLAILLITGIALWLWRNHKHLCIPSKQMEDESEDFQSIKRRLTLYTYNEIRDATNDFHPTNKLGQGGFGTVYKGILKDGTIVAIKKLDLNSSRTEFANEAVAISSVQHRNLVKLLGCCFHGDQRILVLEFMEKNSLHQALLGPQELRSFIDWQTRVNICIGVARGIAYLHEETSPRIIHRDIKSSNILLDRNLNCKIADFGLAKLYKEEQTHISTKVAGTMGYLAPEYAMRGQLTEKADVFSFGILTLEIISGRNNIDRALPPNEMYLLDHVWHLFQNDRLLDIVDRQVRNECSEEEAKRFIKVALFCTQYFPNQRPTMTKVVTLLSKPCDVDVSGLQHVEEDCLPILTMLSKEQYSLESNSMLSSISMPSYRASLIR